MSYLLLVMEPRGQRQTRTRAEGQEAYDTMVEFGRALSARGLLQAIHSLASDERGARVEKRAGKLSVHDGPFAEAKEMIGGFFLLDCKTRDEALAIAAECPAAAWASIEVRETGTCFEDLG